MKDIYKLNVKRKRKRKLNVYMRFAQKHRKSVMAKYKKKGYTGRKLIGATGKELGRMYRKQK